MDEKYKDKPWFGKVKLAGPAQEKYDAMDPDEQIEYDKFLMKLAENPYIGELARPCGKCGQHFWYGDGECPYCGWKVIH